MMLPCVTSSHKLENAIASALGRKMETLANVVSLRNEVEDRVREVLWMRSGEADADFRIDLRDLVQQICEAHPTFKKILMPASIKILTKMIIFLPILGL